MDFVSEFHEPLALTQNSPVLWCFSRTSRPLLSASLSLLLFSTPLSRTFLCPVRILSPRWAEWSFTRGINLSLSLTHTRTHSWSNGTSPVVHCSLVVSNKLTKSSFLPLYSHLKIETYQNWASKFAPLFFLFTRWTHTELLSVKVTTLSADSHFTSLSSRFNVSANRLLSLNDPICPEKDVLDDKFVISMRVTHFEHLITWHLSQTITYCWVCQVYSLSFDVIFANNRGQLDDHWSYRCCFFFCLHPQLVLFSLLTGIVYESED